MWCQNLNFSQSALLLWSSVEFTAIERHHDSSTVIREHPKGLYRPWYTLNCVICKLGGERHLCCQGLDGQPGCTVIRSCCKVLSDNLTWYIQDLFIISVGDVYMYTNFYQYIRGHTWKEMMRQRGAGNAINVARYRLLPKLLDVNHVMTVVGAEISLSGVSRYK